MLGIGRPFQCLLANFVKLRQVPRKPLSKLSINNTITGLAEPLGAVLSMHHYPSRRLSPWPPATAIPPPHACSPPPSTYNAVLPYLFFTSISILASSSSHTNVSFPP